MIPKSTVAMRQIPVLCVTLNGQILESMGFLPDVTKRVMSVTQSTGLNTYLKIFLAFSIFLFIPTYKNLAMCVILMVYGGEVLALPI